MISYHKMIKKAIAEQQKFMYANTAAKNAAVYNLFNFPSAP